MSYTTMFLSSSLVWLLLAAPILGDGPYRINMGGGPIAATGWTAFDDTPGFGIVS